MFYTVRFPDNFVQCPEPCYGVLCCVFLFSYFFFFLVLLFVGACVLIFIFLFLTYISLRFFFSPFFFTGSSYSPLRSSSTFSMPLRFVLFLLFCFFFCCSSFFFSSPYAFLFLCSLQSTTRFHFLLSGWNACLSSTGIQFTLLWFSFILALQSLYNFCTTVSQFFIRTIALPYITIT